MLFYNDRLKTRRHEQRQFESWVKFINAENMKKQEEAQRQADARNAARHQQKQKDQAKQKELQRMASKPVNVQPSAPLIDTNLLNFSK